MELYLHSTIPVPNVVLRHIGSFIDRKSLDSAVVTVSSHSDIFG